nr:MAG TPA: hypothetical protein [Caudoviricetes sp.]
MQRAYFFAYKRQSCLFVCRRRVCMNSIHREMHKAIDVGLKTVYN